MAKEITYKEMNSLNYLINSANIIESRDTIEELVGSIASEFKINDTFVDKFHEYITPKIFSESNSISNDMISKYEGLFDKQFWIESPNKSLDNILDEKFLSTYELDNADINKVFLSANREMLNKEVIEKFFKTLDKDTKKIIMNRVPDVIDIKFIILQSEDLTVDIFNNEAIRNIWTKESIEKIFRNKEKLPLNFFFRGIIEVDNYAWQKRMLNSTDFNFVSGAGTFDIELLKTIDSLHENLIPQVINLCTLYAGNALTNNVLEYIMEHKDLSEDFYTSYQNLYLERGMKRKFIAYIENRGFTKLVESLS